MELKPGLPRRNEIKAGYKQTEVGIIPIDWDVKSFGSSVDYVKGFSFKPKDYKTDGIRIIRVSDTTFDSIKKENGIYIDEKLKSTYRNWRLDEFDIVISTVGSKPPMYDSMVGKVVMISKEYAGSFLNQNAVIIRVKQKNKYKQKLLLNHFRTKRYLQYIEQIFRGNANQASITLEELFLFEFPSPISETEQTTIAQALSDTDELINSLDKLIAKKRNIKQGAMQQLLTGKKRLPGFSGVWETKKLGEECELITKGTTPTSVGRDFQKSGINFIKIESLEKNGRIVNDKVAYIDSFTNNLFKRSQLKENDILFSIAGALGRVAIIKEDVLPANTNQALAIIRLNKANTLDITFVFYVLVSELIQRHIESISVQGAQANLSLQNIYDLPITFPSYKEQTAIAQILSDMDSEIESLEKKQDKYKAIKQGMMQELLTGRIRLV